MIYKSCVNSQIFLTYSYYIYAHKYNFEMAQAYCVKCREKVEIQNPQEVTLKNGRPAVKGTCPKCSIGVFRIGKPQ